MKSDIHPKYDTAKVNCNGCGITFETRATAPEITVDICSNCHPFYTGKQKLVDTAGRVDRFNARRKASTSLQEQKSLKQNKKIDPELAKTQEEIEESTVDTTESDTQEQ